MWKRSRAVVRVEWSGEEGGNDSKDDGSWPVGEAIFVNGPIASLGLE